jgi:TPR repeat protein
MLLLNGVGSQNSKGSSNSLEASAMAWLRKAAKAGHKEAQWIAVSIGKRKGGTGEKKRKIQYRRCRRNTSVGTVRVRKVVQPLVSEVQLCRLRVLMHFFFVAVSIFASLFWSRSSAQFLMWRLMHWYANIQGKHLLESEQQRQAALGTATQPERYLEAVKLLRAAADQVKNLRRRCSPTFLEFNYTFL